MLEIYVGHRVCLRLVRVVLSSLVLIGLLLEFVRIKAGDMLRCCSTQVKTYHMKPFFLCHGGHACPCPIGFPRCILQAVIIVGRIGGGLGLLQSGHHPARWKCVGRRRLPPCSASGYGGGGACCEARLSTLRSKAATALLLRLTASFVYSLWGVDGCLRLRGGKTVLNKRNGNMCDRLL